MGEWRKRLFRAGVLALLVGGAAGAASETFELLPSLGDNGQEIQVTFHPQTGYVNFLGGYTRAGGAILKSYVAQSLDAPSAASYYLSQYARAFGATDPGDELAVKRENLAQQRSSIHYQQIYQSVPVLGGEIVVNLGANHDLLSINGELSPLLKMDTTPTLRPDEALGVVRNAVAKWRSDIPSHELTYTQPTLAIYDPRLVMSDVAPVQLVWVLDATSRSPLYHEQFFVNARTGSIALHYSRLTQARNRQTYDAGNTGNLPGTLVCNEADDACTAGDADEKNAHLFARHTYDYYFANHARDSFDNAGGTMISTAHFFEPGGCPNAFWNGTQTVYCDGFTFDDVTAHEWTHAVTDFESALFYFDQSGAINESLSDVWGEVIDQLNGTGNDSDAVRWLLGEDTPDGAIRDMANPPALQHPDRATSPLYHFSEDDNFGVHVNSGINNKAAFLMADGGSFNGFTITPFSPDRATSLRNMTRLYYEAQTNLLTSGASYRDLYNILQQACANLIGTPGFTAAACAEVKKALDAVEMNLDPRANFYVEAGLCPAGQVVNQTLFSDGFETAPSPWNTETLAGFGNNWSFLDVVERSGSFSAVVNNIDQVADSVLFTVTDLPPLPPNAWLHFHHFYGTETDPACGGFCDGGVVEYSTNGGVSWQDAGPLFTAGKNYDGVLSAIFQNPLGGRSAFSGFTHVYVSSRYSLASLQGQNVRVRFRFGTDNAVPALGWSVDDVSVHTCAASGDTTPDPFAFADQNDVPVNTVMTSNAVTISGISAPAAISVSGGQYSIGCGATFTSAAGSIANNQTVCVRHTSAAANSTAVNTTLTVGGVSDTFTSTTIGAGPDSTPNQFSFVDQTNVARNSTITSAPVTITGMNTPAAISVAGGEYSIGCSGAFTTAAGSITNNQSVCVRHTAAGNFSTATNTVLTVGGVSDTFSSTTAAPDTQPDIFSFAPQSNVAPASVVTSNTVAITGINDPAPVSVTGGEYSIGCGGTFTAAAGAISNLQTVCVRHTAASTGSTVTTTMLNVGGVTGIFNSLTQADAAAGGSTGGSGSGGSGGSNESPGSAFRGESSGGCTLATKPQSFDPLWMLFLVAAAWGTRYPRKRNPGSLSRASGHRFLQRN